MTIPNLIYIKSYLFLLGIFKGHIWVEQFSQGDIAVHLLETQLLGHLVGPVLLQKFKLILAPTSSRSQKGRVNLFIVSIESAYNLSGNPMSRPIPSHDLQMLDVKRHLLCSYLF